jgi:hypothetical protein
MTAALGAPAGSGKTHTMMGTPEQPGVNTRALAELFRCVGRAY